MNNILSCGSYIVGGERDEAMDSIHDVIQLTLTPQRGMKLLKTSYNLDELRDLESKLVLITGSKAENRAAVDQFLDVCSLSTIILSSSLSLHPQSLSLYFTLFFSHALSLPPSYSPFPFFTLLFHVLYTHRPSTAFAGLLKF